VRKLAALALALLLTGCTGSPGAPRAAGTPTPDPNRPLPLPLPDVVARVNEREIRIRQILPLAKAALDRGSVADRDARKPAAVRQALDDYIDRELLLQEAIARGVKPENRDVDWNFDQIRGRHASEEKWAEFLADQGLDAQTFKAEVRIQVTVATLLAAEVRGFPVPESEARALYEKDPARFTTAAGGPPPTFESVRAAVEAAVRQSKAEEIRRALVARLRERARIELYI
jgi:hypothetical protein